MASQRVLSTPMLGLVWFGASVSLAEILTGTFFAPLGLGAGIAAILIGHVIGCALFLLVSLVSAQTGASAMQAVGRSFGRIGSAAFSSANVLQLVGWTAIMVMSGGAAANLLVPALGMAGWCVIIGALIVLWIAIGVKRMGKVQSAAAVLLFALTFVVSATVFGSGTPIPGMEDGSLSFGAAVELAAAMPLSWLPVAGDYTRSAIKPQSGTVLATLAYGIGSCWMFVIGLGCALFAGSDDVAVVLAQAGLGAVGRRFRKRHLRQARCPRLRHRCRHRRHASCDLRTRGRLRGVPLPYRLGLRPHGDHRVRGLLRAAPR